MFCSVVHAMDIAGVLFHASIILCTVKVCICVCFMPCGVRALWHYICLCDKYSMYLCHPEGGGGLEDSMSYEVAPEKPSRSG